jgi:MinD superfamily P-loop ATPase
MKQIVTLSGKGGTGKTTVLASFAALAKNTALADCDVDAANLYLLLHPEAAEAEEYAGAKIAVRDEAKCVHCGECERRCRFDAITTQSVSATACEGCGLCVLACPQKALRLQTVVNGVVYQGMTAYGPMVHAHLRPAAENSGRLVTLVRQRAEAAAHRGGHSLLLMDGPPGIACTATASLVDTDLAVVVTEPSLSGMHDMVRIVQLAQQLRVPVAAIINKADINPGNAAEITAFCAANDIPVVARLPFDDVVVKANAAQAPLVEYDQGPVSQGLREAWEQVQAIAD